MLLPQENAFNEFCRDAQLDDAQSPYCKSEHIDIMFRAVNYEQDSRSEESKANWDKYELVGTAVAWTGRQGHGLPRCHLCAGH